jgi:hypothetical protein
MPLSASPAFSSCPIAPPATQASLSATIAIRQYLLYRMLTHLLDANSAMSPLVIVQHVTQQPTAPPASAISMWPMKLH